LEVGKAILRTSSQLAQCKNDEIEGIIRESIAVVSEIESAGQAGWCFLTETGSLLDVFSSTVDPTSPRYTLGGGLNEMPWCLAQLNSGKPVIIQSLDDLLPAAKIDRRFLETSEVHSFAFLPSDCATGRTVLILLSISPELGWSEEIVEQYTLLGNIFSNAHQRRLALDESQARDRCFQKLFAKSTSPMALLNDAGQFVSTNSAFRNILGYSKDELEMLSCADITISSNQDDKLVRQKHLSQPDKMDHHVDRDLIRKDQSLIRARIKPTIIEFSSPESLSLVSVEDLTSKRDRESSFAQREREIGILSSQLIQSQENERKRLARELHDDIGQRLSLAASEVALMASQQAAAIPVSTSRLDVLRDELDSLCSDIHEMSHNLHSYKLQHLGLKCALKDLCRRLSQPSFRVDLHIDEMEEPISQDVSLSLYRVVQESLNNALKHAHTLIAAVTITKLQNVFYMTIQDLGVGFDSKNDSFHGLGLISMSERIKFVNGQFRIHSIVGRGTEIWVSVPDERYAIDSSQTTHCM
jgi:PAS domain S-box-containing protein